MRAKDHCLILAAGFGTRMGEIGKVLPKVMWPVFHKSLLETQVLFARALGYSNIYINIHHQASTILEMTKGNQNFSGVTWLHELPEILDIGGGVHNLARQPEINYSGRLLILNADQVLWFTKSDLAHWMNALDGNDSVLLSLKVQSTQGYNQLVTENGLLKSIRLNKEIQSPQEILTYSGNAIVDLSTLKPQMGVSKFFDSVCSFDRKNVCVDVSDHPYWDFGTKGRYFASLKRIVSETHSPELKEFYQFLSNSQIYNPTSARPQTQSYNTSYPECINLSHESDTQIHSSGVLIAGSSLEASTHPQLRYNKIIDYLN